MNTNNLPPLPEQDHVIHVTDSETIDCFRADQMREYGQLCRQQALKYIALFGQLQEAYEAIARKDAALKACVEALEAGVSALEAWRFAAMNQYRERPHTGETTQAMNAAIAQAQGAMK